MDMSIVLLFAMGFLTCALVAGLFQTLRMAVIRQEKDRRSRRK